MKTVVVEKRKPKQAREPQAVVPMFDPELFGELKRAIADQIREALDRAKREIEREVILGLNNSFGAMHVYKSKLMEKNGARGGLGGTPRVLVSETIPTREPGRNAIPRRRRRG